MKTVKYSILLTLVTSFASYADETHLTDKKEIMVALEIQNALSKVSNNVTTCLDSGKEHSVCLCKNKEVILEFSGIVNSAFNNYSHWLNFESLNFKGPDGLTNIIVPAAIQTQAAQVPKCN